MCEKNGLNAVAGNDFARRRHIETMHMKLYYEHKCKYGADCRSMKSENGCGHNHHTETGTFLPLVLGQVIPAFICQKDVMNIHTLLSERCEDTECKEDHFWDHARITAIQMKTSIKKARYSNFERPCRYTLEKKPCHGFKTGKCSYNHNIYAGAIDPKDRPKTFCKFDNPPDSKLPRCTNCDCRFDHFAGHLLWVQRQRLKKKSESAESSATSAAAAAEVSQSEQVEILAEETEQVEEVDEPLSDDLLARLCDFGPPKFDS